MWILWMTDAWAERPAPLRNTGPWSLAAEFGGSVVVGFVLPDLLTTPQPDDLDCADAWCDTTGFDRAVRSALVLDHRRGAGTASHVFTLGLTPAVAFGGVVAGAVAAGRPGAAAEDAVMVVDVFLVSTGLNSVAKVAGRRQRPAFHFGLEGRTEAADHPREEFVSFYSGDTTWAFALASSSATVAYLRRYRSAPWIAGVGGALAATGGVLRISADMHWATDVLTGAVTGTALGVGLPLALHGRAPRGASVGAARSELGTSVWTVGGVW